jgi:hypothetical protein
VHKRLFPIALAGIISLIILNWSCTKFDTTDLGSDLIPAVDNIHTFADTIDINSTQGYFDDTTQVLATENFALGKISNDPLFGTTIANAYFQLKPTVYPFTWGNAGDTLVAADSVVLTLSFKGSWGDSLSKQDLQVWTINDAKFRDSIGLRRDVKYQANLGTLIGSATIDPQTLGDTVFFANHKDSSTNQIRIRLSDSFRDYLYHQDTAINTINNAFANDSTFRDKFNGIAVTATNSTGNSLLYISLTDAATRLEMYYRKKNIGTGSLDTVYTSLPFTTGNGVNIAASSFGNYIKRDRAGTPSNTPSTTEHYLQTAPGTYINLAMPGLTGMPNRIIHRAYIAIQQIPNNPVTDGIFTPPPYLYLDLIDTTTGSPKWKPIYNDLTQSYLYDPDNTNGYVYFPAAIDNSHFGGVAKTKTTSTGTQTYYEFNITRYMQRFVTKQATNYNMRIWPAYDIIYPQYAATVYPYTNPVAYGRVLIGSGTNPDPAYRMRLIIIYSNVQ